MIERTGQIFDTTKSEVAALMTVWDTGIAKLIFLRSVSIKREGKCNSQPIEGRTSRSIDS
jgi:hypothetical protein